MIYFPKILTSATFNHPSIYSMYINERGSVLGSGSIDKVFFYEKFIAEELIKKR